LFFFIVRELLHFGIGGLDVNLAGFAEALFDALPLAVFFHHRAQIGVGAGELLVTRGIGEDFRGGELRRHFFVARLDLIQFFK